MSLANGIIESEGTNKFLHQETLTGPEKAEIWAGLGGSGTAESPEFTGSSPRARFTNSGGWGWDFQVSTDGIPSLAIILHDASGNLSEKARFNPDGSFTLNSTLNAPGFTAEGGTNRVSLTHLIAGSAVSINSSGVKLPGGAEIGWGGEYWNDGSDLHLFRDSAATLQLGTDHATTPTAQKIKAHDVTTGTGADMIICGGKGSVAGGRVVLATSATNGTPTELLVVHPDSTVTISNSNFVFYPYGGFSCSNVNAGNQLEASGTAVRIQRYGLFSFSSGDYVHTSSADTGISRLAANSIAIGNGTQGDFSGSLKVANLLISSSFGNVTLEDPRAYTTADLFLKSSYGYTFTVNGTSAFEIDGGTRLVRSKANLAAIGGITTGISTVGTLPTASLNEGIEFRISDALAPAVEVAVAAGGSAKCKVISNGTTYIVTATY